MNNLHEDTCSYTARSRSITNVADTNSYKTLVSADVRKRPLSEQYTSFDFIISNEGHLFPKGNYYCINSQIPGLKKAGSERKYPDM